MKLASLLLVLLCLVPPALTLRSHFALSHDAATYTLLGDSLARGEGYTYQGYAHTKYPPGYPALLAPVLRLWGRDYLVLRIFNLLLVGAAAAAIGWLVAVREGRAVGLAALAALAGTGFFVHHATLTLTDIPFAGLAALACLAGRGLVRDPSWARGGWTGLLIALAASFRLVGLLLLPALVAAWWCHRPNRSGGVRTLWARGRPLLLTALIVALPLAAWLHYKGTAGPVISGTLRDGATYLHEMRGGLWLDVPQGVWATVGLQLQVRPVILCGTCARLFTGDQLGWAGQGWVVGQLSLVSVAALLLFLLLGWRSLRRHGGVLDWFVLIYLGVLMVTPPFVGPRYFIPILPFILGAVLSPFGRPGRRWPLPAVVLGWLVVWAPATVEVILRERQEPYHQGAAGAFVQAAAALPETGVTICNEAALVHLLSGRRTSGFPLTRVKEVEQWILERGDRVLLADHGYPVHEALLRQAVQRLVAKGRLVPVRSFGTGGVTVLLRVVKKVDPRDG